jgi:hypothetical protein
MGNGLPDQRKTDNRAVHIAEDTQFYQKPDLMSNKTAAYTDISLKKFREIAVSGL